MIFDSLKLVHVLDLSQIYGRQNPVPDIIKMISYKEESKQYFNKYLINLYKEKQNSKVRQIQDSNKKKAYKRHRISILMTLAFIFTYFVPKGKEENI